MVSSISDFVKCPKTDTHNHLNLGMRYASYAPWAGFYIPDFPRRMNGLDEFHAAVIIPYTRPRCKTMKDVQDLFSLTVQDAIADNVKVLEGSADISFVHHCGSVENYVNLVQRVKDKFKDKIDFRPELGMGKTFDIEKIYKWAPELLESGVFNSIDLYGPEVEDGLDKFVDIYKLAAKLGIKKKAHVGEFSDAHSVQRFVEIFELDEVQHGRNAADDPSVVQFLREHNVALNICPESNVMLGAEPSYKAEAEKIRTLVDAGILVNLSTDDLLFFNKNNSEQCVDLAKTGLFTVDELKAMLQKSYEAHVAAPAA